MHTFTQAHTGTHRMDAMSTCITINLAPRTAWRMASAALNLCFDCLQVVCVCALAVWFVSQSV